MFESYIIVFKIMSHTTIAKFIGLFVGYSHPFYTNYSIQEKHYDEDQKRLFWHLSLVLVVGKKQ